jgi:catechol 2,3-dioxygenase-like lactoylglutathione lyase family enzyme
MAEFRIAFTAHDYDATVAFFNETMGCEILRSFEEGGKGTILTAAVGQIEVFSPDNGWGTPGVSGAKLAWEVDDADATHAALVGRSATVLGPPTLQPWGHKNFSVEGPDGWTITLYEIVVPQ